MQLCIDFYKASGNRRQLFISYKERNAFSAGRREDQKRLYRHSVKLMKLVDELRAEQERIKKENEALQAAAETDALTGLPNRHALGREMELSFERAYRAGKRFGVGIIDIDRFKLYNDKYGHQKGDECLRDVARVISSKAKEKNIFVARYGGDEFVLLYENMKDGEIEHIAEGIVSAMRVPVSHGYFAAVPDDGKRLWDFFTRADEEMYRIKKAGTKLKSLADDVYKAG